MTQAVTRVRVAPALRRYVVDILTATREHRDVYLGASPRAGVALMRAAKALALLARPRLRRAQGRQRPGGALSGPPHHAVPRRQGARGERRVAWWPNCSRRCRCPKAAA